MWAILLVWLTVPAEPIVGDGRYHTKAECEAFVEFVTNPEYYYKSDDVYTITERDGNVFAAQCIKLED